jgi:hypothetical protein
MDGIERIAFLAPLEIRLVRRDERDRYEECDEIDHAPASGRPQRIAGRALERLARRGLEQPLAVELELLRLKLPLLLEDFALRTQACVCGAGRKRTRFAAHPLVLKELLLFQLLPLKPLIEIEPVETARVGGREIRTARAQALLEVEIERVLLLAKLELAPRRLGLHVEGAGQKNGTDCG